MRRYLRCPNGCKLYITCLHIDAIKDIHDPEIHQIFTKCKKCKTDMVITPKLIKWEADPGESVFIGMFVGIMATLLASFIYRDYTPVILLLGSCIGGLVWHVYQTENARCETQ